MKSEQKKPILTSLCLSPKIHRLSELPEILKQYEDILISKRGKDPVTYLNIPASFDIETSSFYENDEKRSIMYIWQVSIAGNIFIGRTWEEFIEFLNQCSEILNLGEYKRLIFFVHNLSYEFQFIRKYLEWDDVFATAPRKVLYAITTSGIEFRCSYMLSGYSLETVGKNLLKYKIEKKSGDLDYKLIRHYKTALTEEEIGYCINDVQVVVAFIQEEIEKNDGSIAKIPLTKTGYVRRYCYQNCMYADRNHKKEVKYHLDYRKFMKRLVVSYDEYMMLKRAFQGGFTHASAFYAGNVIEDVASYDIASSYPTVMITEMFPMSKGRYVNISSVEEFRKYLLKYCCVFDITFFNIDATFLYENYITGSKCWRLVNPVYNNGRIVSADELSITITELDFYLINKTYKYSKYALGKMIVYEKGYLPTKFVQSILSLYKDKTELKGVEGKEVEYMVKKGMINSCYGMAATDILQRRTIYHNNDWYEEAEKDEELIEKANNSYKRFLFYPWSIYVTAYARAKNLWSAILECGPDYIYSDTDSVKIRNKEKHEAFFKYYNEQMDKKLHKAMIYHDLDDSMCRPKTIEGIEKPLGYFEYEGSYSKFKTLGAKRYMTLNEDGYSMTVSGLNKKICMPYIQSLTDDPMEFFKDDMYIPPEYTGKSTHTYLDDPADGCVTDYKGETIAYHMKSGIHLEESDYHLSMEEMFINYLKGVQDA